MITIVKRGAPTINTIGSIGQHYVDLDGGIEYECVDIIAKHGNMKHTVETDKFVSKTVFGDVISEYIWEAIGENASGGGSGVVTAIFKNYHLVSGDYQSVRDAIVNCKPISIYHYFDDDSCMWVNKIFIDHDENGVEYLFLVGAGDYYWRSDDMGRLYYD